MASSGDDMNHLPLMAQTDFPTAFSEFLERLDALGDRETRDQIRDYYDLWSKSGHATTLEEFKGLVTGNELPFEQRQARHRLRAAEFQLLAIAQHYGMPTPLLDWSQSPFVGWYFALREQSAYYPTVIAIAPGVWGATSIRWLKDSAQKLRVKIDKDSPEWFAECSDQSIVPSTTAERRAAVLDTYDLTDTPEYASFLQFPASSHLNDRLQAQQGILTRHSVAHSMEEIASVLQHDMKTQTLIWKFVLVEEPREKAMTQLRMMNITGSTLFPGLVGAGQLGLDSLRFEGYSAKYGWPYHFGSA